MTRTQKCTEHIMYNLIRYYKVDNHVAMARWAMALRTSQKFLESSSHIAHLLLLDASPVLTFMIIASLPFFTFFYAKICIPKHCNLVLLVFKPRRNRTMWSYVSGFCLLSFFWDSPTLLRIAIVIFCAGHYSIAGT